MGSQSLSSLFKHSKVHMGERPKCPMRWSACSIPSNRGCPWQAFSQVHIYADSWSVANDLTTWLQFWKIRAGKYKARQRHLGKEMGGKSPHCLPWPILVHHNLSHPRPSHRGGMLQHQTNQLTKLPKQRSLLKEGESPELGNESPYTFHLQAHERSVHLALWGYGMDF